MDPDLEAFLNQQLDVGGGGSAPGLCQPCGDRRSVTQRPASASTSPSAVAGATQSTSRPPPVCVPAGNGGDLLGDGQSDGPVTSEWAPHIRSPLQKARARRGKQVRKFRIASVCSGSGPEDEVAFRFGFLFSILFQCDIRDESIRFISNNARTTAEHFFVDFKELAQSLTGACWAHGMSVCSILNLKYLTDILLGGISCKGFSQVRTGRNTSWNNHGDV